MGYFGKAAQGVTWLAVLRGIIRGLTFVRMFFLARMLTPAQFGTFGVASLVLSLVEVFTETGVNIVLVQEKREDFETYLNSAWVVSIIRGTIIGAVIFLSAPFVAAFFNNPDAASLIALISLVPFVRGFINPSIVLFQKELAFNKEVYFRSFIVLVGTVSSIFLAWMTKSPASLAIGMLIESSLEVILSFIVIKPRPSIRFSNKHFNHIFHRGKWITVAGIFEFLYKQFDDIVVGKKMTMQELGYYQMAYRLAMLPITEIAEVFNKVTFPVYLQLAGDKQRLFKAFGRTTMMVSCLSAGFGLVLWLFPELIVRVVLGPQWMAIVPILPILGFAGVIRGVSVSLFSVLLAFKKQEYITYSTMASITVLACTIIPFVSMYGLQGAAWSALLGSLAAIPPLIFFVTKMFRDSSVSTRLVK